MGADRSAGKEEWTRLRTAMWLQWAHLRSDSGTDLQPGLIDHVSARCPDMGLYLAVELLAVDSGTR